MCESSCMSRDADSVEVLYEPGVSVGWAICVEHFAGESLAEEVTRHYAPTTLAIEEIIAARLAEYGPAVARVVHSFGRRDIYLRDGSRIEYRWRLVVSDWRCLDCGIDTDALCEYYMIHDEIWEQIHPKNDGSLCIACVERRLGRELVATDFTDLPINTNPQLLRSPRLADRLSGVRIGVPNAAPSLPSRDEAPDNPYRLRS